MGRRLEFSQEMADAICELIADGQSLRSICSRDEMPCQATVFKWLKENEDFVKQYTHARDIQGDVMFDRTLDIANEDPATDIDGKVDTGDVQMKRLRIDVLKWRAGKLRPKVYGDKQEVEHSGSLDLAVALTDRLAKARERAAKT